MLRGCRSLAGQVVGGEKEGGERQHQTGLETEEELEAHLCGCLRIEAVVAAGRTEKQAELTGNEIP